MAYAEEEFLLLSGLQHFAFCRRQWALIHIEQAWADNLRTTEGELLHEKVHDEFFTEKRADRLITRGLRVFSPTLGISGACDAVEFHACPGGVPLAGREGTWRPVPVEYKRGSPKAHDADELQLCAQALCLEEMLACPVEEAYLYYAEPRRRTAVPLTAELRSRVKDMLEEMHALYRRGHTPKSKPGKHCNACSLKELCLPKLYKHSSAQAYIRARLGEEEP